MTERIRQVHKDSYESYGMPRVRTELIEQGVRWCSLIGALRSDMNPDATVIASRLRSSSVAPTSNH